VVNTVTDWVTVWWDGTSFITPSATPTSTAEMHTQAADSANAVKANVAPAVNTEAPAPTTTPAPVVPVAPVAPVAPAAPAAPAGGSDTAAAAANVAAAAAANAPKKPADILGGVQSFVSSVVAPYVPTPVAPVNTPTPVAVTPPATNGDKRGLAYNNADLANSFTASGSKVSWAYNWGSSTPAIPSSFEYVPMLWGTQPVHSDGWHEAASSAIAKGSKHLLAFNEPDLPAQANLDPGAAAAGYKTFMQPFAGQAKLGSPAVTNGPAPMGIAYLKSFMEACSGCTVDFVPMHWYDAASNVAGFKKHVGDVRDAAGGRKLWITEFGANGSTDEQETFLREVIPWLDSQDYVERYAYFYADGVLTQNSVVTALGNTFMSFVS
jgi:hypothetical protein